MKMLVDAKPIRPPKWWPRTGRTADWVGVLKNGVGWVIGDGDLLDETERQQARSMFQLRSLFRTRRRAS